MLHPPTVREKWALFTLTRWSWEHISRKHQCCISTYFQMNNCVWTWPWLCLCFPIHTPQLLSVIWIVIHLSSGWVTHQPNPNPGSPAFLLWTRNPHISPNLDRALCSAHIYKWNTGGGLAKCSSFCPIPFLTGISVSAKIYPCTNLSSILPLSHGY